MSVGKALAFHSYKGGTGKTTIAINLAAIYAMMGMRVCLLDFDLYAPSLTTYFRKTPESYLNDLLAGEAKISDILVDVSSELGLKGKLFLGFSSPIMPASQQDRKSLLAAIRRFLAVKKELFSEYKMDYVFLDTSPGIRYWSVNAIAASDLIFLMMRINEMDIAGTKKMIEDIYELLIKGIDQRYRPKSFIILNKVPGASPVQEFQEKANERMFREIEIEKDIGKGIQVMGSIPCFCDIQFNKHEFLSAIKQPKHHFSKRLLDIANKIKGIDQRFQGDE